MCYETMDVPIWMWFSDITGVSNSAAFSTTDVLNKFTVGGSSIAFLLFLSKIENDLLFST